MTFDNVPALVLSSSRSEIEVVAPVPLLAQREILAQVVVQAREEPSIGIGLAGTPGIVLRTTPQDAAAYERPPGLPARGGPPTPLALARWWAALLNDYVVICTSPGQPSYVAALSPAAGATMTRLRAALPWQYRAGVANEGVASFPTDLRRRLRAAALQVP